MSVLAGRRALIVGATRGLGRAIALGYAREGASVVGLGRNAVALRALEDEVRPLGVPVATLPFDVTESGAYPRLVEWLAAERLEPDIVVHTPGGGLHALAVSDERLRQRLNAGGGQVPFWEIDDDDFDRVMALGMRSAIHCCKYLAPLLMQRGYGSLVIVGSGSGIPGQAQNSDAAYCAEKGAVVCYVLAIAKELQPYGVAANVLLPGLTLTTMTQGYEHWETHPSILRPEDAVPAAVFLAQQNGSGVTAQLFQAREYLSRQQVP